MLCGRVGLPAAVRRQKSERTEVVLEAPEQLKLFDEAEKEADPAVLATGSTEAAAHKRKEKRTHEELAQN